MSGLQDGSAEKIYIDGEAFNLVNATTGTTSTSSVAVSISVTGSAATVTLTKVGDMTTTQAQDLINGLQYANTSQDPTAGNRTVTLTEVQDSGSDNNTTALSVSSTVTVTAVNDAPTLTSTAANPTYTEDGTAQAIFSGTNISTVESGQSLTQLQFTVAGLQDGTAEKIYIDGEAFNLVNATSGTTTASSVVVAIAVTGSTATVTLTKAGDMTTTFAQTLINGLQYENTSQNPTAGDRTVTLTYIQDSGGTANGGDNDTVLSVSSTVGVTPVNDPAIIGGADTGGVTEDASSPNLTTSGTLTITDVDSAATFTAATISGGSHHGTFTIDTAGAWSYTADNSQTAIQSLGLGSTLTDTFTVTSADGTTHDVTITITGTNDVAVIGGVDTGSLTEDATTPNLSTSGTLTITDVDTGQASFTAATISGGSHHGTFSIDTAGAWSYTADNSQTAIQSLGLGDTLTDTFTVTQPMAPRMMLRLPLLAPMMCRP